VRALTGEEVVISNTNLLNKELHNMARLRRRRRIVQPFALVYQTPPELCARVPDIVRGIVETFKNCALVRCGMIGFGPSSLDFELQFDVMSEDYEIVFQTRAKVLVAILAAFKEQGVQFAYPTQTTFTAAPDGTLVMPWPEPKAPAAPKKT
jgi:small-conductance mechanosensitive channel